MCIRDRRFGGRGAHARRGSFGNVAHQYDVNALRERAGLAAAARKVLPEAKQQRCTVHLTRNVMSNVPKRHQKRLGREVVKVLHAEALDDAKRNLKAFRLQFFKQFPEAVECLERGFDDATTYFAFPEAHHVRIRTTNGLERLHGEIKRRTLSLIHI